MTNAQHTKEGNSQMIATARALGVSLLDRIGNTPLLASSG